MSIAYDDESKELAEKYGAILLLDKMNLFEELAPAIVRTAILTAPAATI